MLRCIHQALPASNSTWKLLRTSKLEACLLLTAYLVYFREIKYALLTIHKIQIVMRE